MTTLRLIKTALYDDMQYRTGTIIRYLSGFFFDYVKVSVWFSLVTYDTARISFNTANATIQYMIVVAAISAIYAANAQNSITNSYLSGELGRRLLLPYPLLLNEAAQTIGKVLTMMCTNVFPTIILLTIIFRPEWNINIRAIPGAMLMIILGLIFHWLLVIQIDILCFWVKETMVLQNFRTVVYKFFSGTLIPLWFMPDFLQDVIFVLPFSKMLYYPAAYLLNMTSGPLFLKNMLVLVLWIILLVITVTITWKKGMKVMETFGG